MRRRIIYAASSEWERLGERLDSLIGGANFELIKRTARTTAGFLPYSGQRVFVKRIESGGALKGWAARSFGSRATRAARGVRILETAGFAHPAPLLIMEERRSGAIRSSYIVTEALREARILSLLALPRARALSWRRAVLRRVAVEIRRLHDTGIYTRDLQETNLMVEERGDAIIVYLVDFEDFRRVKYVSERRRMLNLVHLDRSIGRFASRAKRLRFFYNYWNTELLRDEARRLMKHYLAVYRHVERRARVCAVGSQSPSGSTPKRCA